MRHLTYTALFREAARRHVGLRHSETEMHFGRLVLTGWPLTKLDIDEFLTAQKSKIRLPILLLESYDARYQDNGADNVRKLCQAAFIVLDKPASKEYDARDVAIDRCEEIGEDVLGYVGDYYRRKIRRFDASTISSEKVGPIGDGLWGTRFNFQLPELSNAQLTYDSTKFLP